MASVSVIIPLYNASPFIAETIGSVQAQTFKEWNAVIVDDGSTDDSLRKIRDAVGVDPRWKVIARQNRGVVATLNEALQHADGRLIARLDADDVAPPDRFEKQVEFLESHAEVGLLGAQCVEIDPSGALLNGGRVSQLPRTPEEVARALPERCVIISSAAMFRRSVLSKVGVFRQPFASVEDYDLWLRISEVSDVANLDDCLVRYRVHPNSLSRKRAAYQALYTEVAKICAQRRRQGRPDPVGEETEVSAELLESLGLDARRVREIEFRGLRSSASQSLIRGAIDEATQLMQEGSSYISAASTADKVEFDILKRRLALAKRQYLRALKSPGVVLRNPGTYARVLWGKFARRMGR